MMESSPKPVVAAIHGTALGGGLEVALCAHYRIAVPSARCGLPEVNLGLLPGAGGTQRLPRIAGPQKALEMMTSGTHVPAAECLAMGLVDELAAEGDLRADAVAYARRIAAEGAPLAKISDRPVAPMSADEFAAFRTANAKRFRGFKAPEAIIQTVEAAVNLPFAEGMEVERQLFTGLVTSPESAAQRYVFFAEREVWKMPDVPADTPTIPVASVGIIGAGTMGGGIAMNFANAGVPGDHRRDAAGGPRPGPRRRAGQLRAQRPQRSLPAGGRRPAHGSDHRVAVARRPGRRRSRHRGGVRAHGREEGRVHPARRHRQARCDAGHQHRAR